MIGWFAVCVSTLAISHLLQSVNSVNITKLAGMTEKNMRETGTSGSWLIGVLSMLPKINDSVKETLFVKHVQLLVKEVENHGASFLLFQFEDINFIISSLSRALSH